jgi:hypothetical protein
MKNIFLLTLLFLFSGISNAQLNFLNSDFQLVPSYTSGHNVDNKVTSLFSDTSIINANGSKLDILHCTYIREWWNNSMLYHADATYRINTGNINFDGGVNIFNVQGTNNINNNKGIQFIKLNTASTRNDAVIWRDLGFEVYTNTTSGIGTTVNQSILGGTFSFQNMLKGSFVNDNTLNQYKLEDLITYGLNTNDNKYYYNIYKNLGNGYFDANAISIQPETQQQRPYTKMISAQIDLPISPYAEYYYPNQINKSDIVALKNNIIYVFLNDNNNGISTIPVATITKSYTIYDFTVCDINNDGYNELIIAGEGGIIDIHNNTHYTFHSDPFFTLTNSTLLIPYITTGDFDRDGWSDLVVSYGNCINIYKNQYSTNPNSIFSGSACQFITNSPVNGTKLIAADLHNLGGLSLLVTGLGNIVLGGEGNGDYPWTCEGQIRYNSSSQYSDPPPAPPTTLWSYYEDGTVYRPKILINNRGEKDFKNYQVWKYKTGWSNWVLIADNLYDNYYIDYTEWINNEDGGELIIPNCFYKTKSKDLNDNLSVYSEQLEYIVGDNGCLFCGDGDHIKNNLITNNNIPSKYSVNNYPNPFNPVTKIKYELPKDGRVNLVIYDMLGRVVETLVNNEFKQAGSYLIEFNGSKYASGVYFYRIQIADFSQIKRMVLIK